MKKLDDIEILRTVAEYRVLTVEQLAELLFASAQMARRRLREMGSRSLIARSAGRISGLRGRPQALVWLGAEGRMQLKATANVSVDPKKLEQPGLVEHQILCNWFRILLLRRETNFPVLTTSFISSSSPFSVDEQGNSLLRNSVPVKPRDSLEQLFIPDGAFTLVSQHHHKGLLFFLEVDLGTEALANGKGTDVRQKLINYRTFLGTKRYKRYETLLKASFRGFRLLFLTHSTQRRSQLCRLVRELAPLDFIWVGDQARMFEEGLAGNIWAVGGRDHEPPQSILGSMAAVKS
ncbi:MAG: replication-relaxation family protein [Verrucomicrobia bacterium]|nr:replication-relaxation family protein [Verrucomicrobiota bacterium]